MSGQGQQQPASSVIVLTYVSNDKGTKGTEANKLSQMRATAWSDSDDRELQIEGEQG